MNALAAGPSTDSWKVHGSVNLNNMVRGPNRLTNPGFESGTTGWIGYGGKYTVDSTTAHSGTKSARVNAGSVSAAVQQVTLNQPYAKPIYVSGWSKAVNGPGGCKMNYSLYFDIKHTDGTTAPSPYVCFSGGTHDWEYVEQVIVPTKPVATIHIWTMLNSSVATVWFDDLAVGEYAGDIRDFDAGQVIYAAPTDKPWQGSSVLTVSSGDGLDLGLTQMGAAIASLRADGQELADSAGIHASGFYVRDVAAGSDFIHLGGTATQQGNNIVFQGSDAALGLQLTATFQPAGNHIVIDASLKDTRGQDRAVSLYFALPIASQGWTWWKDIRVSALANSQPEHRFALSTDWGSNGFMSHYTLSSLSGPAGLALAYPMDQPSVSRFAYNSSTYQYYFVSELGLSARTQPVPSQANVRFLLYKHDPAWGFRAAFDKYVQIYPRFFERRVQEDGVWVAHAELDGIPNIADFNIRFHETGNSRVYATDDALNAYTLRYLTEPWGYWLRPPTSVNTSDYNAVMTYVNGMLTSTVENTRRWGQAILSSGIHDANGRYTYEALSEAFASHAAAFVLNGNPTLTIPGYTSTKATQAWSPGLMEPYSRPDWGILDGEYIDSFESRGVYSNFRQDHFPFSRLPLTFDKTTRRVVLPQIWSNYELAKKISDDIHGINRYVMANSALLRWGFPAHLFDIMGSERGWVHNGAFLPDQDSLLNLWRTYSYRKPYAVLQNGDLTSFNQAMVEEYFQYCTFYGIYPSFFTHDGGVTNYWNRPDWYERDRAAHVKYIPIIKDLNQAGWEPVTGASSGNGAVYVERYGSGESFYLTLRNATTGAVNTTVAVDLARLGLPAYDGYLIEELLAGGAPTPSLSGNTLNIPMSLPGKVTRVLRISFSNAEFHTIALGAGWNLIALPGEPYSIRASDVFAGLTGRFERAYGYDAASQSWLLYEPRAPYASKLTEIRAGQGLWVYASAATSWRVGCVAQASATLPLRAGWNLVGVPFSAARDTGAAVAPLGDAFEGLFGYIPGGDPIWEVYGPAGAATSGAPATLDPGKGYWVSVTRDIDWTLPAQP
jgi:hypothetical protein